jgi:Family of unknown function (DUF5681)
MPPSNDSIPPQEHTTSPERPSGQFVKGTSGNPTGRPLGSRNKASQLAGNLPQENAPELTRKIIELALAGDPIALRFCMSRLVPVPKDRPIDLDFGPVGTLPQITAALPMITQAICEGRLTPNEGETLTKILATQSQLIAFQELRDRVAQLTEEVATLKKEKTGPRTLDIAQDLQEGRHLLEAAHEPV